MRPALDRLETHAGAYAERRSRTPSWLDRTVTTVLGPFARWRRRRAPAPTRLLALTHAAERSVRGVGDWRLRELAASLRAPLQHDGFRDELVAQTFAIVREAAWRTVGQRHRDVQLVGGSVLLDGQIAEMETGEGKTLTATLPACAAALVGVPVHVVTVNDYLAQRDAEWMAPIYQALGLSVGVVVHDMDADARRAAYACDVTYCTNKELGFDYLRDRLVLGDRADRLQLQLEQLDREDARAGRLVLRGLHYAIVDEADSVLVDEARTPLVISGAPDHDTGRHVYQQALALADRLDVGDDFRIDAPHRQVILTARGQQRVEELARPLGGVWTGRLRREDLVRQALTARHLFRRDAHYLVGADGRIAIVDEFTGRLMADRSWEAGLHQLIEVKEGRAPTSKHLTLARISYQRLLPAVSAPGRHDGDRTGGRGRALGCLPAGRGTRADPTGRCAVRRCPTGCSPARPTGGRASCGEWPTCTRRGGRFSSARAPSPRPSNSVDCSVRPDFVISS